MRNLLRLALARRHSDTPAAGVADAEPVLSQELLQAVCEALPTAALVVNGAGDVVLANPTAKSLRIIERGRLTVSELNRLSRVARRHGSAIEAVIELPDERGTQVHALARPVSDDGDVVLLLEDMTEARRVEAVRRDFVANVSHELKTPVGALSVLAEATLDGADDPAAVRRFAERMRHEAQRLGRLVQELIDLSRLQGGEPLPRPAAVPVTHIVEEAVDRARLAAGAKGIDIVTADTSGLAVWGDARQLVTALANLLDNAIAYSPDRTRVAVGVRLSNGHVEVSVTDQGIGIRSADIERIFERFFRVDPARSRATGGTGLGLAIVKHIVANHGGTVGVWSAEGAGSTFTLRLPVSPEAAATTADGVAAHPVIETMSRA